MRMSVALTVLAGVVTAAVARADANPRALEREVFFETRIRPVLATTCIKCHAQKRTENNLRVDRRAALIKGGDSGPAIVPGNPEKSLLIRAVRYHDDDLKMPPDKKLPDAVVSDFEQWVRDGAVWPEHSASDLVGPAGRDAHETHWAFRPVRKEEPPRDASGWSAGTIDCFIHAGLAAHHLKPGAPADKRTLLRRAYFDLIGLPPGPREVDSFLADHSANAFANVVEKLLGSPQYGERWGRFWMDVVRYADTAGDNADYPVPEARLYRDYIIDAFNADKPYDQFVREQVAGDLLAKRGTADKYAERVIATGFLALSRRYATAPYELWHLTLEDTIDTVGRAYLGMTLRCARCHDHKFDPIATRDYYALYGVFASTQFPYAGSEEFQSMKFGRRGLHAAGSDGQGPGRFCALPGGGGAVRRGNRPPRKDEETRRPVEGAAGAKCRPACCSSNGAVRPTRCLWPTRSARGPSSMRIFSCMVSPASPGREFLAERLASFRDARRPPPGLPKAAAWNWPNGSPRRKILLPRA